MLNGQKISARTNGGGDGFLRPSDAVAMKTRKGISPPLPSSRHLPFDEQWPYAISPLRAYLCGVLTVWVIVILYHFVIFAIHAVRKRKITTISEAKNNKDDRRSLKKQPHSLHTAYSFRPIARMAEMPPKSPVYKPCTMSVIKVHRKLAKNIARRSVFRTRRKSRRELIRSKTKAKKAELLPISPSYELFKHMNSQPLRKEDGGERVTESRHYSFVFVSPSEKNIIEPQRSNDILPEETNDFAKNTHEEGCQEDANTTESNAFVILISSGVYEYTQKAHQKEALDLFNDLQIAHKTVDGMDPLQRELRNHLFQVSGIRGNYPQIFCCSSSDDNNLTFLGGYDWLQTMTFEDLRKIIA